MYDCVRFAKHIDPFTKSLAFTQPNQIYIDAIIRGKKTAWNMLDICFKV